MTAWSKPALPRPSQDGATPRPEATILPMQLPIQARARAMIAEMVTRRRAEGLSHGIVQVDFVPEADAAVLPAWFYFEDGHSEMLNLPVGE